MTDALVETLCKRGPRIWAVGVVITGQEIALATKLREHGTECYLPTYTRKPRPRKFGRQRVEEEICAAIPGYIFIKASTVGNSEDIHQESNFLYFIRQERYGDWYLLPDEAIEELQRLDGGVLKAVQAHQEFRLRQHVRIPEGAFGGLTGVVTGTFKDRVMVAIQGFRKPISFPALHLIEDSV